MEKRLAAQALPVQPNIIAVEGQPAVSNVAQLPKLPGLGICAFTVLKLFTPYIPSIRYHNQKNVT